MPDRDDLLAAHSRLAVPRVAMAGTFLRKRGINQFRCPVCGNVFRYDDLAEPSCTGPGATDDHPMAVMVLEQVVEPKRQW